MIVHYEIKREDLEDCTKIMLVGFPFCEYSQLRKDFGKISDVTNLPYSSRKPKELKTIVVKNPTFFERFIGINLERKIQFAEYKLTMFAKKLIRKETKIYFMVKSGNAN